MITPAQFLRLFRLPFSHGGRNALFWQVVTRGHAFCHAAARVYRATLARRKRVVMVVGSYGKTTTTRATAAVLGEPLDRWLDVNANCLGLVAWSLLRQPPWRRYTAIEAGIGKPDTMRRYAATLRPQIVIVTCVGSEHLQSFRDQDHLRHEKAEAVRALSPTGTAILNADDPNVLWMATQTRARILLYGFAATADVRATSCTLDWPHGMTVTIAVGGESFELRTSLWGRNSAYALLAAVTVAIAEGLPPAVAVTRLSTLSPTPGRLKIAPLPDGAFVLCDDYKGTVETVFAAFDALDALPAPRKFIVIGGLDSPRDPQRASYRAVAEHAARVADHVIVVGPSYVERIYAPTLNRLIARDGRMRRFDYAAHLPEALQLLRAELRPGDVVLLKGQGQQHLSRLMLALQGREVRCLVDACRLHLQFCFDCPYLSRPGPIGGLRRDERIVSNPLNPIEDAPARATP